MQDVWQESSNGGEENGVSPEAADEAARRAAPTSRRSRGAIQEGGLGTPDAFEREVARHRPAIYGAALRLTRDYDEAEDLTQDALGRALRAYPTFDGANFRAWLVRIVSNLYINDYKAKRRHPTLPLQERAVEAIRDEGATMGAARLIAEELSDEVWIALSTIPTIFARPILMIDVAGVSYDEFALAEGIPVGTVRSRLSRARVQLRKLLADYAEREGYFR